MSSDDKNELDANDAKEIIADVDSLDREAARVAVSEGVEVAKQQWVPVEYIAEALALELTTIAENKLGNKGAANYLRALAEHLDEHKDVH